MMIKLYVASLVMVTLLGTFIVHANANATATKEKRINSLWINELDLDEEQQEKLRMLWQNKRATVFDLRDELQLRRQQLKNLLASDGSDEQARDVHKRILAIQTDLGNIDIDSMLAIRELLTPLQRIKFVELMNKRGKFGEAHGR